MSVPDIWGGVATIVKLMLYIGVTGSTGLVIMRLAFSDIVSPLTVRLRMHVLILAGLALIAAIAGFMLRGAALTGGVDGMTDPEMLGLLWQTPFGDALVFRVTGTALIIAGVFIPRIGFSISLAGGVLALWSFAQLGHVPELEQAGVRVLLLAHLLGIAFWVGVLGPLRSLSRRPESLESAAKLGHRFGQAAAVVVPGLILAGLIMAWLLLGELWSLVSTGYGLMLLVKLGSVGVLLALAAANKLRFVPAMQAGDIQAAQRLARSVEVEAVVILVVLAATAALTSFMTVPT
jgi:copper resistance protein D